MTERRGSGAGCISRLALASILGLSTLPCFAAAAVEVAQRFNDCDKDLLPGSSNFPTQTMYREDGFPTEDFEAAQAVSVGIDERVGPATRHCRHVRSVKGGSTIEHYAGVTLELPGGESVTLGCGKGSRCHLFGPGLDVSIGPEGLQTPIGSLMWGNSEGSK